MLVLSWQLCNCEYQTGLRLKEAITLEALSALWPITRNAKPASPCELAGLAKTPNHALVRPVSLRMPSSALMRETSETFPLKGNLNCVREGRFQTTFQTRFHSRSGKFEVVDICQ
jgi:hypothetical protein